MVTVGAASLFSYLSCFLKLSQDRNRVVLYLLALEEWKLPKWLQKSRQPLARSAG
mgnify:CR=1 FL=1